MSKWRQRWELCSHKARDTKDCWQPPEAERSVEHTLSQSLYKKPTKVTLWLWTSGFLNYDRIHFVWSHPACSTLLWQDQETEIGANGFTQGDDHIGCFLDCTMQNIIFKRENKISTKRKDWFILGRPKPAKSPFSSWNSLTLKPEKLCSRAIIHSISPHEINLLTQEPTEMGHASLAVWVGMALLVLLGEILHWCFFTPKESFGLHDPSCLSKSTKPHVLRKHDFSVYIIVFFQSLNT